MVSRSPHHRRPWGQGTRHRPAYFGSKSSLWQVRARRIGFGIVVVTASTHARSPHFSAVNPRGQHDPYISTDSLLRISDDGGHYLFHSVALTVPGLPARSEEPADRDAMLVIGHALRQDIGFSDKRGVPIA
jgi:hypothetical protein